MAETKYGKYLVTQCMAQRDDGEKQITTRKGDFFEGASFSMNCRYITKAYLMVAETHVHDFDQYLCFFGSSPNDVTDFDAEIEIYLGEEKEKHIINSPTIVRVPAGLPHDPINIVKLNKPVLHVDVAMASKYAKNQKGI